jgi:hypothetical protein
VYVYGVVGHRGDEIVVGPRYTGIGARERLAPSTRTASAGLTEDVIPVGATVTASGHRHLDEATLEVKTERLTWNGKVFNVYPERN